MPRHLQPTVRQLPPIRQLIAGAAIAGAVAVAIPATASAGTSTCEYNASNKNVIIDDRSGHHPFRIVRAGDLIAFTDGLGAAKFCTAPGSGVATVHNTERIAIFRAGDDMSGGVNVDLSGGPLAPGAIPEADGLSEVEVQISDTGKISDPIADATNDLVVTGSSQADVITAQRNGHVNFGADADIDIRTFKPLETIVKGGAGDDILSAGLPVNTAPPGFRLEAVTLNGQGGKDTIVGNTEFNRLIGGDNDDRLYAVDTTQDSVFGDEPVGGQPGNDFATVDINDRLIGVESFLVTSGGIGELDLEAKPGKLTRMRMSWTHPKAWKALKRVELQVYHGTDKVGRVVVRPASGKVTGKGDIDLVRGSMGHEGKAVTAKLALRLPKSLAGETLSVDVAATDGKGRTQVEPAAAVITVSS